MPRRDLEALQLERLRQAVTTARRSPSYRQRLGELGVDEADIRTLDDVRRLPFTTKDDLRSGFPYGFLCVSLDEVVRMHSSSGTTGQVTVIFHTRSDIDTWADLVARSMYATGMRKQDVFQNMMSYGLFTGGLGFHYGAERIGALTIPAGAGNSKRQIFLLEKLGVTAVHIIPSYALSLTNVFQEVDVDPRRDLKLRIAFLGAEPHSEATRRRVEDFYGLDAYNSYGLSEMNGPGVAFECTQKDGMHVWEDCYLLEVIDPVTLEPLPDGQEGELVFTTLRREAMPILRYRTKDLASVYSEPCPCGRTHRRISRIKGRIDDMMIVKGVNIFPVQIETALMKVPELGSNFLIELERRNLVDEMTIKVEVRPEFFAGDLRHLNELREQLVSDLRTEILITPRVELVEPNSLPVSEGKAVRVYDKREL
ncbi:MAG: phenylacetate--CoA ligase [Bacteroidetes bacterium]|nr:phenylacetate--CoA ligase [Bacteroidota bacterium]